MRNFLVTMFVADGLTLLLLLLIHMYKTSWPHPFIAYGALAVGVAASARSASTILDFEPFAKQLRSNGLIWVGALANIVALTDMWRHLLHVKELAIPFM